MESIAPGQAEQLWDYVKDSSFESLSSNDNNHSEDGEVVRSTLSDSTLRNLVDDYIKLESGEELLVPKPIGETDTSTNFRPILEDLP